MPVHALPVDDVAALLEDLSDLGDGADWLSESVTRARLLSFGGDLSEDDSSEDEDETPKLDPRLGNRLASKARSRKRAGSGLGVRVGESDYSSDEEEEAQGEVGQRWPTHHRITSHDHTAPRLVPRLKSHPSPQAHS